MSGNRREHLARLSRLGRPIHLDWWRQSEIPRLVPCVACGSVVCVVGEGFEQPEARGLPERFRAGPTGRAQDSTVEPGAILVTCPNCKELHEVRVTFKEAA